MSFTQQTNQGVVFHTADAFSAAGGIAHGFATRIGGVSKAPFDQLNLGMTRRDDPRDVLENYRRLCAALGTDVDHLVMTHQVHRTRSWRQSRSMCWKLSWNPSAMTPTAS